VCHPNCANPAFTVPFRRFWHSAQDPHANDFLVISLCFRSFLDFSASGIPVAKRTTKGSKGEPINERILWQKLSVLI
jgi:hypothetical protein